MSHLLLALLLLATSLSNTFQSVRLATTTVNAFEVSCTFDQSVEDSSYPDQLHSTEIAFQLPSLNSDSVELPGTSSLQSLSLKHYPIRAPPLA